MVAEKQKRKPLILVGKKKKSNFCSKAEWVSFEDKKYYFRSQWEKRYAKDLEWRKEKGLIRGWEYEPQTFWFEGIRRGVVSYKPDFKVIELDGTHKWIEVKGYLDPRSKTKIKRFRKYFPEETLTVLNESFFK